MPWWRRPFIGGTCPTEVNLQDEHDDEVDDDGDDDGDDDDDMHTAPFDYMAGG